MKPPWFEIRDGEAVMVSPLPTIEEFQAVERKLDAIAKLLKCERYQIDGRLRELTGSEEA